MASTFPFFDNPCIFTRELRHLKTALRTWVPQTGTVNVTDTSYETMYLTDCLPIANQEQRTLIDSFLSDAATHLPPTIKKTSIRAAWKATHPDGTPSNIDEYLARLISHTYYYAFYFYYSTDNYASAHDGKTPSTNPFARRRWAKGADATAAQHQAAEGKVKVYRNWLLRTIFHQGSNTKEGGQKNQVLILLPIANVAPNYQDDWAWSSSEDESALDKLFPPAILGSPDIAVPIGDVPYQSRITGRTEHLPVVVGLVGAPGSDWELVAAVERIVTLSGRLSVVRTGKRMFESP